MLEPRPESGPLSDPEPLQRPGNAGWGFIGAFFLLNLVVRLPLLRLNEAEYTDGVLQLLVFDIHSGLYPPLYGALAWLLRGMPGGIETGGRVVSVLAAAAAVVPIYITARRLSGTAAAWFACLLFTLAPLVLRWSLQVMSDSLFMALSAAALFFFWDSMMRTQRGPAAQSLAWAMLAAAAAALTRYQGALLLAIAAVPFIRYIVVFRSVPLRAVLFSIVWIALPEWIMTQGFVHAGQFTARTTGETASTLAAYANLFESFVLVSPYYFGYPIALFAVAGLFRSAPDRNGFSSFLWLWGIWALLLLILQSVFGSFQYRYMMPLLPGVVVLAGNGCAAMEQRKRGAFRVLFLISVIYLVLFGSAVLIMQRQSFGDQRAAAKLMASRAPRSAGLFANERYGTYTQLGCVKFSFWSGRRVQLLEEHLNRSHAQGIPAGSFVAISNAYGGEEHARALAMSLEQEYVLRPASEVFSATVYPLFDDVMVSPMFNQNPLAWVMRYTPQHFTTRVYVVERARSNQANSYGRSDTSDTSEKSYSSGKSTGPVTVQPATQVAR